MQTPGPKQELAAARESLSRPLGFDAVLAKLPAKDRANAERRVAALEAENGGADPRRAGLWRRLACALTTLAPHASKLVGRQTVQFYVADGKYRMQVFALEDLQDGHFTVYCPDVLDDAVAAGLLARHPHAPDDVWVVASSGEPLRVEPLDGSSPSPAAHVKDLTGWNRKAVRVTLPPSPSPAQVEAAELLCAMAAQHFARTTAPSTAAPPKP